MQLHFAFCLKTYTGGDPLLDFKYITSKGLFDSSDVAIGDRMKLFRYFTLQEMLVTPYLTNV